MNSRFFQALILFSIVLAGGCICANPTPAPESTTTLKVVCNPPYIRFADKCCLDANSNRVCDRDENPTTTTVQTYGRCVSGECTMTEGQGPSECSVNGDCAHNECFEGLCKEVIGPGNDSCGRDKDCRHNECANEACVEVLTPGQSVCQLDYQCQSTATHKGCVNGDCVNVRGEGQDECSSNTECRHKECQHTAGMPSKCVMVNTPGQDACKDDFACFNATGGHCMSGQCRYDIDSGPDCSRNSDCYHMECQNGQCLPAYSPGSSQCSTDLDCAEWEYHYECQDGFCVKVNGGGTNQCEAVDAQCRHMECQNHTCVEVFTPGKSTCHENDDCAGSTHKACSGGLCVVVAGSGEDECILDEQCA